MPPASSTQGTNSAYRHETQQVLQKIFIKEMNVPVAEMAVCFPDRTCFLFLPQTQLDYISQFPLQLGITM